MKKGCFYTMLGLAILLSACSKENAKKLEVNPDSITIYAEGTIQLTTNVEDATFSSADEFYAKVDETGLVSGNKVGETEITVSSAYGTLKVPVSVINQYSLYPDVDALIGKSRSDIVSLLGSNYTTSTSSSGSTMYSYLNPTSYTAGIVVSLTGGKCDSVGVLVSTSNTSMLTKHLLERYSVAGMQNDYYFFLNHDKNVVIALNIYNVSYLMVMYLPYTPSRGGNPIFDFSKLDFSSIAL